MDIVLDVGGQKSVLSEVEVYQKNGLSAGLSGKRLLPDSYDCLN